MTRDEAFAAVVERLRAADRVLLVTHTHPDGDAIGSIAGMRQVLLQLGKRVEIFIAAHDLVLPDEIDTQPLGEVVTEHDVQLDGRLVVFLDCGNADRSPLGARIGELDELLDIDHHHDNTRFGTLNLIDPAASSTAEMVWELAQALGAELTRELADALYLGLVTDTGRFTHENTTPRAHEMAAALLRAGVDVAAMRRRLYEDASPAKLRLLGIALRSLRYHGEGRLVSARITAEDFAAAGATEAHSEGIIDALRTSRGVRVAALARELELSPGNFKVSVRATDPAVDVSMIARAGGGGGHRQAAGFTTDRSDEELARFILDELAAQDGDREPA